MNATFREWGWLSAEHGAPQRWTFPTADAAIKSMQERLGPTTTVEDMARLGFKLCLVNVTIEPLMVLQDPTEATAEEATNG